MRDASARFVSELFVLLVSELIVLRVLRLEREFRLSTHDFPISSVVPDPSGRGLKSRASSPSEMGQPAFQGSPRPIVTTTVARMDLSFFMTYMGALASFLALGAMVTHLLLSKEILPSGSMLEAAQWALAVLSLVAAIVSIIDTMVEAVGPAGDAVGPSISGIVLFVVLTVIGMAAIVLAAVAYDAHKERKEEARSNG